MNIPSEAEMPILLYNLELTQDELIHLFALLELRQLKIGPDEDTENSMLAKVERLIEGLKRSPLQRKPRKHQPGDNPAYRAFVRTFGCVACYHQLLPADETLQWRQNSATECAHVGRRGLSQKCPDSESLPLCAIEHHRVGPESHHVLGKRFWGFYGLDRTGLIKQMQSLWAEESARSQNEGAR